MEHTEAEPIVKVAKRRGHTTHKVDPLVNSYLVYKVEQAGDIIYIGSGIHGREQHCTSGCSHVYGLNERHFNKVDLVTTVIKRFNEKKESMDYEKQLICLHKPLLNIRGNPDVTIESNAGIRGYWDKYFCTLGHEKRTRYNELLESMLEFYGAKALTSGGVSTKGYCGRNPVPSRVFALIRSVCRPIPKEKYKEMYELTGIATGKISLTTKPPSYLFDKKSNTQELHTGKGVE